MQSFVYAERVNRVLEDMLRHYVQLTEQVATLTRSQAETRRVALSRPLLAAVDSVLPGVGPDRDSLEQLRRCLRLADSLEDPDDVVASVLPAIWEQVRLAPQLSDSRLLSLAIDNLPVSRIVRPLSVSSAALGAPQRTVRSATALGASAAVPATEPRESCFRCGRFDHSRGVACGETTFRTGEPIPPGQKCRFAPAHWKARYGFNSKGYAADKETPAN